MSYNANSPLRVAIIGAGIGGLALALALSRIVPDVKVDVYEQANEIKEIGAGIVFWPRTWEILKHLGVDKALEAHLPPDRKPTNEKTLVWRVKKSDLKDTFDIFDLYHDGGPNLFHRATAQKTLLESLPPTVQVHLAHGLVSYDETENHVVMQFDNQPSQICELLVAADGIKSGIRKEFIEKRVPEDLQSVDPIWGGTIAYRSLISTEKIREAFPDHPSLSSQAVVYSGEGNSTITYPILQGRSLNVVILASDFSKEETHYEGPTTKPVDKEFIIGLFSGWSDEYMALLKSMDTCSAWPIQYLRGLKSFAAGRVALIGDAAHAMPPTLGSGAGQAIEDAYTLAHLLSKAVKNEIPMHRVAEAYTKTRQPLANIVLQRSHDLARLATFHDRINVADKEMQEKLLQQFVSEFEGMFDWWKDFPVEKEIEKALNML